MFGLTLSEALPKSPQAGNDVLRYPRYSKALYILHLLVPPYAAVLLVKLVWAPKETLLSPAGTAPVLQDAYIQSKSLNYMPSVIES